MRRANTLTVGPTKPCSCPCTPTLLACTQSTILRQSTAAQLLEAREALGTALGGFDATFRSLEARAGLAVAAQAVRVADLVHQVRVRVAGRSSE